jgi:hypothetical protein
MVAAVFAAITTIIAALITIFMSVFTAIIAVVTTIFTALMAAVVAMIITIVAVIAVAIVTIAIIMIVIIAIVLATVGIVSTDFRTDSRPHYGPDNSSGGAITAFAGGIADGGTGHRADYGPVLAVIFAPFTARFGAGNCRKGQQAYAKDCGH